MGGCHSTSGVKSFLMDWKVSLGIQKLAFSSISKGVVLTRMTLAWSHLDLTEWKLNQISFEQDLLWTLPGHHLEKGLMTQFDRENVCRWKSASPWLDLNFELNMKNFPALHATSHLVMHTHPRGGDDALKTWNRCDMHRLVWWKPFCILHVVHFTGKQNRSFIVYSFTVHKVGVHSYEIPVLLEITSLSPSFQAIHFPLFIPVNDSLER